MNWIVRNGWTLYLLSSPEIFYIKIKVNLYICSYDYVYSGGDFYISVYRSRSICICLYLCTMMEISISLFVVPGLFVYVRMAMCTMMEISISVRCSRSWPVSLLYCSPDLVNVNGPWELRLPHQEAWGSGTGALLPAVLRPGDATAVDGWEPLLSRGCHPSPAL